MTEFSDKDYEKKYGDYSHSYQDRVIQLLQEKIKNESMMNKIINRLNEIDSIKWNTISFCIYTEPAATPRPRVNRFTHTFYVKGAAVNRKKFRKWIDSIDHPFIHTPFKFQCDTYIKTPSSMTSVETILAETGLVRPIGRPDWDNFGKTYSDMIHEGLILDDSLIIDGRVRKFYSKRPRVEIFIEYMDSYDSPYNEKKMKGRETE